LWIALTKVAKPPTILRPASGLDSFPDAHAYVWCLKIQHARHSRVPSSAKLPKVT